ncbi:MAG TPA: peptidoglycan-binding protein [Pyrinomonadaceae bacterium]|nr:peptidoglycan-binding protein [Pyrinomonadaceae bacterium]
MSTEGHPRGVWIWRAARLADGLLDALEACKVGRVYFKVCDGRSRPVFWSFQCTPEAIGRFRERGIEVYGWGYHYGAGDIDEQVGAVRRALEAGVSGYVFDVEKEVEDPATHDDLERLLRRVREVVPGGRLGYTSFGHPGKHPRVPWRLLDEVCDIALPQIYFEKFTFGRNSEAEVQSCLAAHHALGLTNPIMPIWGSESDAATPAPPGELQRYLDRFPGSSVWRVPNAGERGHALRLNYGGDRLRLPTGGERIPQLPALTRLLVRGTIGDDVTALQTVLEALGHRTGGIDGDFGPNTERAVRSFQLQAGLTVDGEVGPDTWGALGGSARVERPDQGSMVLVADIAQAECSQRLSWNGPGSAAEKYLEPLREPMRRLGQHPAAPIFYNWCAAFVTWCCRQAGIDIPDRPEGYPTTMALVETWKHWAKVNGFWHPATLTRGRGYRFPSTGPVPRRGDIVVFEWFDGDVSLDHIGIVRGYQPGSDVIQTAEGNRSNLTVNGSREVKFIPGFIRIVG